MYDAAKPQNIKIPLTLFKKIIELLECWDILWYDSCIQDEYHNVLAALRTKQELLDLRKTYSKIVYAEDDDQRHTARINYLQQKNDLYGNPYR